MVFGRSDIPTGDEIERIRSFTRNTEFDYVEWTLNAMNAKLNQSSLDLVKFFDVPQSRTVVFDYNNQV